MNNDLKNNIVAYAQQWAANSKMSQSDLAKHCKINAGYLSNMLRGIYKVEVDGKPVEIADKWFYMLADATGCAIKKQYWAPVQTKEFEMMIHELRVAKNDSRVSTLINDTGYGKTYSIDRFCMLHPMHTIKVTVNSMYKVRDILQDIAEQLGTPLRYNSMDTLRYITNRLKELKMQGHQPLIIIDEAENLKLPVIQMLKGLYDNITGYASIVMIGTSQLTDALHRMNQSDRNGAPQFYRRIKAGIKVIPSRKDFTPFYDKFKIDDKNLQKLLNTICNNYGELHDYLEPVLKEADENEKPVTEHLFRIMYNMPKN